MAGRSPVRLAHFAAVLRTKCEASFPSASSSVPGSPAAPAEDLAAQFAARGFVTLGPILSPTEVAHWAGIYDRDHADRDPVKRWVAGGVQAVNCAKLVQPESYPGMIKI